MQDIRLTANEDGSYSLFIDDEEIFDVSGVKISYDVNNDLFPEVVLTHPLMNANNSYIDLDDLDDEDLDELNEQILEQLMPSKQKKQKKQKPDVDESMNVDLDQK